MILQVGMNEQRYHSPRKHPWDRRSKDGQNHPSSRVNRTSRAIEQTGGHTDPETATNATIKSNTSLAMRSLSFQRETEVAVDSQPVHITFIPRRV